ncbi:hypothetical protein CIL05_07830 [Virgibacillus profundi]|uniref:Uncharacterized protein n=1 Tax=Virgibacillus profundi TaxID=2024555 RepID=A0A2A2IFP8_9BACI|nr:hypothetical protein [Virgibacillus profundi]PAV30372.1 hypothetical protein CIL05_07830 [Virgibacillus profundi]PXY54544.1 hypothetical protein CIT14_07915 [Virgibacillus profundi]
MNNNIKVALFIKNGGQDSIVLPKELMFDLATNIRENGSEFVHLSSGRSLEVTGILITGSDFHKEERVIVAGVNKDDE